jgi:hypothetical protein
MTLQGGSRQPLRYDFVEVLSSIVHERKDIHQQTAFFLKLKGSPSGFPSS